MTERSLRDFIPSPAQFARAFEVGNPQEVHPVDLNGVILASIKALHQQVEEQGRVIAELRTDLERVRASRRHEAAGE